MQEVEGRTTRRRRSVNVDLYNHHQSSSSSHSLIDMTCRSCIDLGCGESCVEIPKSQQYNFCICNIVCVGGGYASSTYNISPARFYHANFFKFLNLQNASYRRNNWLVLNFSLLFSNSTRLIFVISSPSQIFKIRLERSAFCPSPLLQSEFLLSQSAKCFIPL